MISEFDLLSEKISQLASLTQALRRENADLRRENAGLKEENRQLVERMESACRQVSALIQALPATDGQEEVAE